MADDTRDYIAVTRLQARYADVINRRAWPELADLFEAGCVIRVDTVTAPAREIEGPQALGEFIGGAIERFDFFEFVILNSVVEIATAGDEHATTDWATGRVFMCEIRRERESGHFTTAFGVYHDRYRRAGAAAGWRFARRDYQSLARTDPPGAFAFPQQFDTFVRQEPRP